MSNKDANKAAEAAFAVMNALKPLSTQEISRVLQSAAALFGVSAPSGSVEQGSSHQAQNRGGGTNDVSSSGAPASERTSNKKYSLVELIKEKEPATNYQRIACFAYYREKFEGKQNFTSQDLSGYFALAKLPAPGPNYARDYNNAVKQAWIHDEGANSYLTQDGEAAVEAGFSGKRKAPKGSKAVAKKKGGKAE